MPFGNQLREKHFVGRVAARSGFYSQRLAKLIAFGVGHHRIQVGIIRGDRDETCVIRRMRVDVILGQALEFTCWDLNRPHILSYVLIELVTDGSDFILQFADFFSGFLILVHAIAPEVCQCLHYHISLNLS